MTPRPVAPRTIPNCYDDEECNEVGERHPGYAHVHSWTDVHSLLELGFPVYDPDGDLVSGTVPAVIDGYQDEPYRVVLEKYTSDTFQWRIWQLRAWKEDLEVARSGALEQVTASIHEAIERSSKPILPRPHCKTCTCYQEA